MGPYTRLVFALGLMSIFGATAALGKPPSKPESEIVELENKWAECFHSGNPEAAKQFIANDFVGTSSKAVRYSKAEALRDIIDSKGKYRSFVTKDVTVRVYGDAAIAQGIDVWETAGQGNEKGSSVWTDTWVRTQGKWQLVAAQDAVPVDLSR